MGTYCFRQIHIDAARNSTDDFNPFHEPRKCARILGNPYAGPIVLGFQLEQLVEHAIDLHRDAHGENAFIADHALERVHKLSLKDGKLVATWGSQGLGPGQFDWVHGIVVDSKGAVYAGDTYGQRLQKFVPAGSTSSLLAATTEVWALSAWRSVSTQPAARS